MAVVKKRSDCADGGEEGGEDGIECIHQLTIHMLGDCVVYFFNSQIRIPDGEKGE
jgi:hypothetical protein